MGASSTKKSNVHPRSIGQNNSMVLQRRYIDDSLVTVSSSGSKEQKQLNDKTLKKSPSESAIKNNARKKLPYYFVHHHLDDSDSKSESSDEYNDYNDLYYLHLLSKNKSQKYNHHYCNCNNNCCSLHHNNYYHNMSHYNNHVNYPCYQCCHNRNNYYPTYLPQCNRIAQTCNYNYNCNCANTKPSNIPNKEKCSFRTKNYSIISKDKAIFKEPSHVCKSLPDKIPNHNNINSKPQPHFVDLTPLIKNSSYDIVTHEYNKNKLFLSQNEKNKKTPLSKQAPPSHFIPYVKGYRLHSLPITYMIALTPAHYGIYYATSSIDRTIKLWSDNFYLISTINNQRTHSNCIAHYKSVYILSVEGICIFAYEISTHIIKYVFRIHTDEIYHILLIEDKFISCGKDRKICLWDINPENVVRYYKGHNGPVRKVVKVFKERNIASISDDRKVFIWEFKETKPISYIDTYYTCADIVGTKLGFITGSYDNKIRLYSISDDYSIELYALFETDYYYCRYFIQENLSESVYLFCNYMNEVIALDVQMKKILSIYKGPPSDKKIILIIREYYWENLYEKEPPLKYFIAACQDGCIYIWYCMLQENNIIEQKEEFPEIINAMNRNKKAPFDKEKNVESNSSNIYEDNNH